MPQPSPEETEESDEDDLIWRPSLLLKQEEEALALSSPYRVRRSRCETKDSLLTEGYLTVTGRGGMPNSPERLLLPSSSLEDLGNPDFSLGSRFSNASLVQPEHHATERLLPSKLLEAGSWHMTPEGKIKLMAHSQVSHVSMVQPCKLKGEELG